MEKINHFNHYYAAVCSFKRPEGMDMHPVMLAYRLCAQYPRVARNCSLNVYQSMIILSYANNMREAAKFESRKEEIPEALFDCLFSNTLMEVSEKVWNVLHK